MERSISEPNLLDPKKKRRKTKETHQKDKSRRKKKSDKTGNEENERSMESVSQSLTSSSMEYSPNHSDSVIFEKKSVKKEKEKSKEKVNINMNLKNEGNIQNGGKEKEKEMEKDKEQDKVKVNENEKVNEKEYEKVKEKDKKVQKDRPRRKSLDPQSLNFNSFKILTKENLQLLQAEIENPIKDHHKKRKDHLIEIKTTETETISKSFELNEQENIQEQKVNEITQTPIIDIQPHFNEVEENNGEESLEKIEVENQVLEVVEQKEENQTNGGTEEEVVSMDLQENSCDESKVLSSCPNMKDFDENESKKLEEQENDEQKEDEQKKGDQSEKRNEDKYEQGQQNEKQNEKDDEQKIPENQCQPQSHESQMEIDTIQNQALPEISAEEKLKEKLVEKINDELNGTFEGKLRQRLKLKILEELMSDSVEQVQLKASNSSEYINEKRQEVLEEITEEPSSMSLDNSEESTQQKGSDDSESNSSDTPSDGKFQSEDSRYRSNSFKISLKSIKEKILTKESSKLQTPTSPETPASRSLQRAQSVKSIGSSRSVTSPGGMRNDLIDFAVSAKEKPYLKIDTTKLSTISEPPFSPNDENKTPLKRGRTLAKAFSKAKILSPKEESLAKKSLQHSSSQEELEEKIETKHPYNIFSDPDFQNLHTLNLNLKEEGISKEEVLQRKKIQAKLFVFQELYATEKNYVENLKMLEEVFVKPLKSLADSSHPIMTRHEIDTIFSSIEEILVVNQKFLEDLKVIAMNYSNDSQIGTIFHKHFTHCEAYTKFVDSYTIAKLTLRNYEEKSNLYKTFINGKAEHKRQNIGDHFILPIQRITRYIMLLQDLTKHTDQTHGDYLNLSTSLTLIKSIASKINEVKRKEEQSSKLLLIQNEVENCPVITNSPDRKYIQDLNFLEYDPIHFTPLPASRIFLFSDHLMIARYSTISWVSKIGTKKQCKYYRMFDLKTLRIDSVEDVRDLKFLFKITTEKAHQYCFQAAYHGQKQDFLDVIKQTTQELL